MNLRISAKSWTTLLVPAFAVIDGLATLLDRVEVLELVSQLFL